jgi:Sap-like sulfolipid-1-addressing protein
MWIELLLLAVASAFWPLLLAVDVVALHAPHPARLLACFLAGGLLTCVVVGTLIVQALQRTSLVGASRPAADPAVYLGAGVLALLLALVLARRPRISSGKKKDAGPSLYERALQRGAPLAFLAGVVLNVVPGVFPFVALKDVAQLDYDVAATAAVLMVFYVVMFALVEVPLVSYLVAPERTTAMTADFNRRLSANGRRIAVVVLEVVGAYLVVRGFIALL